MHTDKDNSDYVETIHGSFHIEMNDIDLPPPHEIKSKFKSIKDWLTFIVDNEKQKKSIETYNFDVFEGKDNYTLCLTGVNKYDISKEYQKIRIEYAPN